MSLCRLGKGGWCVVALSAFVVGCGGAATSTGAGSLRVTVKDVSMAVVVGATVTTTPGTKASTTDAAGHVVFSDLAAGTYVVRAVEPTTGAAEAQVSVKAGAQSELTLILKKTDDAGAVEAGGDDAPAVTGGGDDAGVDATSDAPETAAPGIVLQTPTADTNGVNLTWSSTATFQSFRIFRASDPGGAFAVINIVNDPKVGTYRDETVQLGGMYRYRINGATSSGGDVVSNVQSISAGISIALNSQVEVMRVDPKRPYLYAVDKVNNSVHFVNLTTNTVEKKIFVGSSPTDLDINAAGTEAYVANSGSTEIAVIDLATRVKSRSVLVDPGTTYMPGNPYRVVCTTGDTLVWAPMYSSGTLRLVNALTGATLTTSAYNSSYGTGLTASPDGTHVYSTGYNGVLRYDIVGATLKQVDTSNDSYGSSYAIITKSKDGMFIFAGPKKVLAANLKSLLGTFPEAIQASNLDGSVVVGATRIYDGATFAAKATLPLSMSLVAFSADDKTLYLYNSATSRIFVYKTP
jgi:YVTN family beta-propeller protein